MTLFDDDRGGDVSRLGRITALLRRTLEGLWGVLILLGGLLESLVTLLWELLVWIVMLPVRAIRGGRAAGRRAGDAVGERSPERLQSAGGSVWSTITMIVLGPPRWLWRQVTGTAHGLRVIADKFAFDRVLPSGIVELLGEIRTRVEWAFGAGSKSRGVFSGIVLIIFGVLTSWSGVGIGLIVLGILLVLFNLLRAIPAIENAWEGSRVRGSIQRDHDSPLWTRDNDN